MSSLHHRIRFCNLHTSIGHPIVFQVKCQLSYCSLHANILALILVHSGPSNREDQLAPAAGAAAQIGRINLKVLTLMKPCDMIQDSSGATQFYFILFVYLGCFFFLISLGQASLNEKLCLGKVAGPRGRLELNSGFLGWRPLQINNDLELSIQRHAWKQSFKAETLLNLKKSKVLISGRHTYRFVSFFEGSTLKFKEIINTWVSRPFLIEARIILQDVPRHCLYCRRDWIITNPWSLHGLRNKPGGFLTANCRRLEPQPCFTCYAFLAPQLQCWNA